MGIAAPAAAPDPTAFGLPADSVTAYATALLAIATIALFLVAIRQLPLLTQQIRLAREAEERARARHIESATLQACERYTGDLVIHGVTQRIWLRSNSGKDYSLDKIDEHDLIIALNYLDGIAIGVKQGVYSAEIVKDHMESTYVKVVEVIIPKTFGKFDDYEAIKELRDSWTKPKEVAFKSRS